MYERLTNVVNELERVVFSLDKGKPRGENEALVLSSSESSAMLKG